MKFFIKKAILALKRHYLFVIFIPLFMTASAMSNSLCLCRLPVLKNHFSPDSSFAAFVTKAAGVTAYGAPPRSHVTPFTTRPLLHTIGPPTNASSPRAKVARQRLPARSSRLVEPVRSHRAPSSSLKGRSLPASPPDTGTRCSRGGRLKCNR